jgi:hypothetical protein
VAGVIRDRLDEFANAARAHPDEHARACCAFTWWARQGRVASVAMVRRVAADVGERVAAEVVATGTSRGRLFRHGRQQVGGRAVQATYELRPGPHMRGLVEKVERR